MTRTNLSAQVADEVRRHFGDLVCNTVIPRTVRLSEAPSFGQPISVFDPTSRGAIAYRALATEVRVARRSGLGKGIEALIPTVREPDGVELQELPVDQIRPNHYQPRVEFDDDSIDGLAGSIAQLGVLQPILVRPRDDGYELIAGERRWRAAQRAGLERIPALVREIEDQDSLEQALVENLHREDLNPLEEAAAYELLISEFDLTQDQVADRVGKSRPAIANTIRLLQLPPPVQQLLVDGSISAGHGRALLGLPDPADQQRLAVRCAGQRWTVRQTEAQVRKVLDGATPTLRRSIERTRPSSGARSGVPAGGCPGHQGARGARRQAEPVGRGVRRPRRSGPDLRGAGAGISGDADGEVSVDT
ncbi:MAG: ParB/RepB/Spo0J family partition protein [Acidimicrobiales bacterium]